MIHGLSGTTERPKTAFELLNKARYEDAWQAYLGYFLNPGEPHELGGGFLSQFFTVLEEDGISFSPPRTEFDETIDVTLERQSDDDNRPDIIITSGTEWFLCIELKVHSPEGRGEKAQTRRYANDPGIVPGRIDTYEDGGYLYIKPASAPCSASDRFVDIDWTEVQTVIDDLIVDTSGSVSTRTLAQLSDFSTLIESQLTMTTADEDTRKRKDLYFEYRDEIKEVENAIESFVKSILQQRWGERLETEYRPANTNDFEWKYQAIGNSYGQVRVPRWETAKSGPEKLDIHWEHRPEVGEFKKGQLRFILELEEIDRGTMDEKSGDRYHKFREDILERVEAAVKKADEPRWKEFTVDPSSTKKRLVRFVYEYPAGDEEGYYQSLQFALEDTWPVTELVTELLESTDYTKYPVD